MPSLQLEVLGEKNNVQSQFLQQSFPNDKGNLLLSFLLSYYSLLQLINEY